MGDGGGEGSSTIGAEGQLRFHSRLTLMERTLVSLKVRNLKVHT